MVTVTVRGNDPTCNWVQIPQEVSQGTDVEFEGASAINDSLIRVILQSCLLLTVHFLALLNPKPF